MPTYAFKPYMRVRKDIYIWKKPLTYNKIRKVIKTNTKISWFLLIELQIMKISSFFLCD